MTLTFCFAFVALIMTIGFERQQDVKVHSKCFCVWMEQTLQKKSKF